MGFKLGSFLGGVAKGATDLLEEKEKENALQIKESIKNMYHNYAEYKKETEKKKTEIRDVVGSLRSFKFADGPLDEKELIALASDVPTAKVIAEQLQKNPEKIETLSKSFIKGSNKIPEGMTFNDYVDQYGKTAKISAEQLAASVNTREEGFLNKLVYGNNLQKIQAAAAKYGVTAEDLYSTGSARDAKSLPSLLEVDYAKLKDKPDFKKLESDAMVAAYQARQNGTDEDQLNAAKNLGHIEWVKSQKPKDLTQAQTENNYANEVLKLKRDGKVQEAAAKERELRDWQRLVANPNLKEKPESERISQANLIVAASRTMESTLKNYLPPGSFITTSNPDGTTNIEVKDLASSDKAAKGYAAGREVLIKEMTKDGKPRSEMHKNALLSAGVQFDGEGNAVNPKVNYGGEAAPAKPAQPARRGGPMAAPTGKVDVAAARRDADAAIAKGANRAAVAERFKETTGQEY